MSARFRHTRIKAPARRNDLRHRQKPKRARKGRKRQAGFESKAKMRRELKKRRRSAGSYAAMSPAPAWGAEMLVMAAALLSVVTGAVGPLDLASFANPLWVRELRRRLCGELLRVVRALPVSDVWFYTIASPEWRLAAEDLFSLSPRKLRESLRTNLIRYGELDRRSGWCITVFHNEYDSATDSYQPHFHVICVGEKRLAFEALRKLAMFRGGKGKAVYRPIKADPLDNAVRQCSYLLKQYWPAKVSYRHAKTKGKRRTRKHRRIPEPRHAEVLLFLHQQRFSDFVWLHGIKIHDGRLRAEAG